MTSKTLSRANKNKYISKHITYIRTQTQADGVQQ